MTDTAHLPFLIVFEERATSHNGVTRQGETHSVFPEDQDQKLSEDCWVRLEAEAKQQSCKIEIVRESRQPKFQPNHFDGGIDTVHYLQNVLEFASAAGAGAFLKTASDIIFRWKKLHDGRSIKIKVGSKEISVRNPDDLEQAISAYEKLAGR